MAVKGKKNQNQQKPVPKLVKPAKEEEEEESDDVEDEEQEEQSDEEVGEKDEELEEDEDDEDDKEEEEDDEDEEEAEKKTDAKDSEEDKSMQTTVFVGHINYRMKQNELEEFFSKAGEIESSRIIPKRGYAFVTYKEEASVAEALKLDKEVVCGKAVHVERVKTKRSDNQKKQQLKRKHNKEQNDKGAKKAKVEGKTVNFPKKEGNKGAEAGKGKPKTAQQQHPNKKQNKPAAGKFVKPVA